MSALTSVRLPARRGLIRGALAVGEDHDVLGGALQEAADWVRDGTVSLLTHAHLRLGATEADRDAEQVKQRSRLVAGRLKRYVLALDTSAGPRIIKLTETVGLGSHLRGLFGGSTGRREHQAQLRAASLELAATESRGYLEWRAAGGLLRSLQVQTPLAKEQRSLDAVLHDDLQARGDRALQACAAALAETHRKGFAHLDLKPFHAFVTVNEGALPERYTLRWLDLGRVSFRMSERQRRINLYQTFRFVLPPGAAAQRLFIEAYCRAAQWRIGDEARALLEVQHFLDYKLRTHPNPYA